MAKIYISYNQRDAELARDVSTGLQTYGHEITIDVASITPGADWRAVLNDALKRSDAFVAVLTRNALESQFVASEIGAARAFGQAAGEMLVIPVIADEISVPPFVSDLFAILAPDRDVERVVAEIDRAVAAFLAQRAAREKRREDQKTQLEANAAVYVDEAITSLRGNEIRDRRNATIWYSVGVAALFAGIAFGFWSLREVVAAPPAARTITPAVSASATAEWLQFARAVLKAAVVIGLLVGVAKYAFVLGKSYMSEALKSADRIHAISYGRFYLRAFGTSADPQQLKDVFQHWNIDRPSAFGATTPDQFDPKYVETIIELAKLVTKAGEKKA